MASIDYQEARREIVRMFSTQDVSGRKIIFWYDAPKIFYEDVKSDTFDCCRVLICERNEFTIKKTIEHDDPDSNFLIYIPTDRPVDTENWLLDILMYSEEYYADTVALTMRRLGLTSSDLRRIVERYQKFFDSEARIRKLADFVQVNDQMSGDDFKLAMLCVLAKANARTIESVLTELVFDNGTKAADIQKFGFEEYLWDEISRYYNFDGDQKVSSLIRKFLFTALLEQKADFGEMPSYYQQFIIEGPGKMDAKFFIDKLRMDKRYPKLQAEIATEMSIEGLLVSRDIACVSQADVFECIDVHVIRTIAQSLKNGSLDYDTFDRIIEQRRNSIWYGQYRSEYELLSSCIAFYRLLDRPIPKELLAAEYVQKYTETYWQVDYHYRHFCVSLRAVEHPMDEFDYLADRVELTYQIKFLDVLGKEFSDALSRQAEWRFGSVGSTSTFYRGVESNRYKKCFVIISDGFRYEIAHELFDRIQMDSVLKGTEKLSCAIAPLPSETRFGMASLLPHQALTYQAGEVLADGMPTNSTQARNTILQGRKSSYAAIQYEDIAGMSRNELRAYMADKSLVYIYHNVVDNAGEHNERRVFDVAETAIQELLDLIKKLYNNLQISNFYITADHGFIFRRNAVMESDKYGGIVSLHPAEANKRYVISDDPSLSIPYTLEFPLSGNQEGYRVILPYGYDLFKTQGSGLQYIHGGASLQEIVVPIIHIGELRAAKNKDVITPVGVRLKSVTRKITNRSFALDFEQTEKVEGTKQAISCETYMVDEEGNMVSGSYTFVASSSSDDPQARVTSIRFTLMNIQFDRNKRYFLILRNTEKQDEYIEREQFVIDILGFRVF